MRGTSPWTACYFAGIGNLGGFLACVVAHKRDVLCKFAGR